jgi:hypothetical protein
VRLTTRAFTLLEREPLIGYLWIVEDTRFGLGRNPRRDMREMRSGVVLQYRANCAPSRSYWLSGMNTLIGCSATPGNLRRMKEGG